MRPHILSINVLCALLCVSLATAGTAGKEDKTGADNLRQGWWWYMYDPPEEDNKQEKDPQPDEKKPSVPPPLGHYTKQELWDMHPDVFQPLLADYRKKAVMLLTEDSVQDYLTMQDVARRKAKAYMNVSMLVVQKNPELSVLKDYPTAAPGRRVQTRMRHDDVDRRLLSARDDFALLYFHSFDCGYCAAQGPLVDKFAWDYGWEVRKIDIDERPDLSEMFAVSTVPLLLLIHRDSRDPLPIAAGVLELDKMVDRIYSGVRLLSGEITPEQMSLYEFQKGSSLDPTSILSK